MARPIEYNNGKRELLRIAYATGGVPRLLKAAVALNVTANEARALAVQLEAEREKNGQEQVREPGAGQEPQGRSSPPPKAETNDSENLRRKRRDLHRMAWKQNQKGHVGAPLRGGHRR